MEKITLEPSLLLNTLEKVDHEVQLCDSTGRTVGYFLPATESEREFYRWAQAEFTDEELDRAAAESGGRTTAEVFARLAGK